MQTLNLRNQITNIKTISSSQEIEHLSSRLIPNIGKKGVFPLVGLAVLTVAVGGIYLGGRWMGAWGDDGGEKLTIGSDGKTVVDANGNPTLLSVADVLSSCPDDGTVDFTARVKNTEKAGTAHYMAVTGYVTSKDNTQDPTIYNTSLGGAYTTRENLNCDGKSDYSYSVVATNNTFGSGVFGIGVVKENIRQTYSVPQFGRIQVKAKDVINDAWIFKTEHTGQTDGIATSYINTTVTLQSSTNTTAYAMGVGSELSWDIWAQTAVNTQYGNEDENDRCFVVVDADTTQYDEPTVRFDNNALTDVKKELPSEYTAPLSGYEYIFEMPKGARVDSSYSILNYYTRSKSGVNPTVDQKVRFLCEGHYLSDEDGVTVKKGLFRDDSGTTEVFSDLAQEITLDIS